MYLLPEALRQFFRDTLVHFYWLVEKFWEGLLGVLREFVAALAWLLPPSRNLLPLYVPLYLLLLICFYAVFKARHHTTVIVPFSLPQASKLPFGEQTVAHMLRDSLALLRNEAEDGLRAHSAQLIGIGPSELTGLKLPELTTFGVLTRFAVEVKGLSYEGVVSLARKVLGRERTMLGDVVADSAGFFLIARAQDVGPWQVGPYPAALNGLQQACKELAVKILEDLDPTLLAAYELSDGKIESARLRLRDTTRDPQASDNAKRIFELVSVVASVELAKQGKDEDSQRLLEEASALLPRSPLLAYNTGVRWQLSGRPEALAKAIANYERALQMKPDFPEALSNLGLALTHNGQADLAITKLRKALRLKPDYPAALNNFGIASDDMGKFDDAVASYERALEIKPEFPEAMNNLGNALSEKGQIDEAIGSYKKALELRPNYPDAFYNWGNALVQKGQIDEAIASYKKALELRPNYPEALSNLGVALYEKGKLDEAIAMQHEALRINPDYPEAHNNLGVVLHAKGNLEEAIASYEKAIKLRPHYPKGLYNLAITLEAKGALNDAIGSFRKAVQLKPNYPSALDGLGKALARKGKLREAIATFNQALTLSPNDPEVLNNLAIALALKGQYDEAIATYNKALTLAPSDAKIHYNLGMALLVIGQKEEAQRQFADAQQLDPKLKPPAVD